jgi:hypothetical protein
MDPCHLKPISYLAFEASIGKPKLGAFLPEIANFDSLRRDLFSVYLYIEVEHTDFCTA